MCAAEHGHSNIVNLLVEAGANLDWQDTEVLAYIIEGCTMDLYLCIQNGCTALTIATQAGQVPIVQVLLETGADLNIQEKVLPQYNIMAHMHTHVVTVSV